METLLVFAEGPGAATAKSRLAVVHGEDVAQALHSAFLLDLADTCGRWRAQRLGADLNRRVVVVTAAAPESALISEVARRCEARVEVVPGTSMGARVVRAFELECERGARSVCAIGPRSAALPAHLLDEAFRALVWERVVLGPTFDDGCWLVGCQRPVPDAVAEVGGGGAGTLPRALERLRAADLEAQLLPFWYDVEATDGVERLAWHLRALRARHPAAGAETWRALSKLGLAPTEAEA